MFALRTSARILTATAPAFARASPKFATRAFSSSLSETLQKEIESAKEGVAAAEEDVDFSEFKKEIKKLFKIEEEPGLTTVKMTRQHKSETITVSFDCSDVTDDYLAEDEEPEDEEEDGSTLGLNFKATVEKAGSKITAHCVAGHRGLQIRLLQNGDSQAENIYQGPDFSTLDENLQEEIFKYLDERKVDEDLSAFVHAYAQQKEQKEYLNWIEGINKFFHAK